MTYHNIYLGYKYKNIFNIACCNPNELNTLFFLGFPGVKEYVKIDSRQPLSQQTR